jgi:hypothetical protein
LFTNAVPKQKKESKTIRKEHAFWKIIIFYDKKSPNCNILHT